VKSIFGKVKKGYENLVHHPIVTDYKDDNAK